MKHRLFQIGTLLGFLYVPCLAFSDGVEGEYILLNPPQEPDGFTISSYPDKESWLFWDPVTHAMRGGLFTYAVENIGEPQLMLL